MKTATLPCDPFNLIITGVGGQGNVLASRIIGNMLSSEGFLVTIGETFGASQRGGSVMSHLRISETPDLSPQIPKGRAHMVVALEPSEALRVLMDFGNPDTAVLCNTRAIHPVGVISGDFSYPAENDIKKWISELSATAWFLDVTAAASEMGHPVLANAMMAGALAATGTLPLSRSCFEQSVSGIIPADKTGINMQAWDAGYGMI